MFAEKELVLKIYEEFIHIAKRKRETLIKEINKRQEQENPNGQ